MKTAIAISVQYQATFQAGNLGRDIKTIWYGSAEEAQEALMRRREVGHFPHLGRVSGDAHEAGGPCLYAPRNGGAVSIDRRGA